MRRKADLLSAMALLGWVMVASAARVWADSPTGTLKAITPSESSARPELALRVEGPFTYKAVQATEETIFIDLEGVKAGELAKRGAWSGGFLMGYQLIEFTSASGKPVVRVQVESKHHEPFKVQQDSLGLRLLFARATTRAAARPATSPVPTVAPSPAPTPPVARPNPVQTAPAAKLRRPTVVSKVSIKKGKGGETFVDISTSQPTTYHVMQLSNPRRLVVDLHEAQNAAQKEYLARSPILKAVRVGQFRGGQEAVVRVVADLEGDPTFDVHAQPGGVRIELKSRGRGSRAEAPEGAPAPVITPATAETAKISEPPASPQVDPAASQASATEPQTEAAAVAIAPKAEEPAPPALEVARVDEASSSEPQTEAAKPAEVEQAAVSPVILAPEAPKEVKASTPQVAAATPMPERVEAVAATPKGFDPQATLPGESGATEVAAAPRPRPPLETPEMLQAARAAQVLVGSLEPLAVSPQGQEGGTAQEGPKYTGEPISLNLKDVDLKDFFRLIHEISGLNLIIDPNVTGSVTLVLDAVPWDQALDIVLKNNRLGKTLEGNVLRIARIETLTAEQESSVKLAEARAEAQPLVTVFRPANYAKASTIVALLKSWVGGGALTKRGNILVDDRTNTLIISDIQSQIPIIESIISKLDTKAKQVQIEARVVRANVDFSRNLASALSASYNNLRGNTSTAAGSGTNSVAKSDGSSPLVTTSPVSAFGVYAITNAGARYTINAAIAAAETRSQLKTISRPTIVTQNNVPGTVLQGTQIPVQTSINNTISITYVNATLTLNVTPQVTEDGNIFLTITVNNAAPGAVIPGVGTAIETQQATTQVLCPDGGTVVFGGVTVTRRSKSSTQVPLLGSIPVIGNLFKSSSVSDRDEELLFFVSPRVLPG